MEICLKYLKFSYSSRTTKCNSKQLKKVKSKVNRQLTSQQYKQHLTLSKLECMQMIKLVGIIVKVRNSQAIQKALIKDMLLLHFLQAKLIQLSIHLILYKITWAQYKITITLLYQPMEIQIQESMLLLQIFSRVLYKMDQG